MSSPQTLSHEIAAVLRSEILRHQYRPGERMPSERDLAARFNASRGAVREALSQLEQLGIISVHPGGARVQPVESATLAVLGPLMALEDSPNPDLVDQFLEMFGILMGLTVKRAVELATAEQISHVQEMLVKLGQQTGDFATMEPHWRAMLDYLSSISDNLVVRLIGNDLKAQFLGQMLKLGIKPRVKSNASAELIKTLRQALMKQDPEQAAAAFRKHFEHIRAAVRDVLREQQLRLSPQAQQA